MQSAPSIRRQRRLAEREARRERGGFVVSKLLLRAILAALALMALYGAVQAYRAWTTDPLARGRASLAAGDDRAARVDLTAALASNPRNLAARIDLARALNGLGRGSEAERQLATALELGASADAVRVERARAMLDQDRPADALAVLAGPVPAGDAETAMRVGAQAQYRLGNVASARQLFDSALDVGHSVDSWIAFARFRLDEQDVLGADRAADEAIRRGPDSVVAWAVKADVVRSRGGPVAALPWYQAALRRNPDHVPTLLAYAASLGEAGRGQAMLVPLHHATDLEPGHPQGLALRAMLAARGGEPALARTLFNRIGGPTRTAPAVLLTRAAVALMLETPIEARDLAATLVQRQPDNRVARRLLALAQAQADNPLGVIQALDPITTSPDADTWSLLFLSRALAGSGAASQGDPLLTRAYGLDRRLTAPLPSAPVGGDALDPRVAIMAIRAQLAAGQTGSALALAAQLADANPGVPQARLLVGDVALASGDAAGAARAFRRAAQLRFDQQTMLRLVAALQLAGDRNAAGQAIDEYLARWPDDGVAMRIAGNFAAEGGNWSVARDYLVAAMARVGNNDALLLAQVARSELELGNATAALSYAARAYRLFPGNASTSGVYGLALHRTGGDRTDAHELLMKAVQLAPADALLARWAQEVG